jgi:hypothetical protein
MPESSIEDPKVAVALAQIRGSIDQLTSTVALRLTHVENEAGRIDRKAQAAHDRADTSHEKLRTELIVKIETLQNAVDELEEWKQRVVGAAAALGMVGGSAASLFWWVLSRVAEAG